MEMNNGTKRGNEEHVYEPEMAPVDMQITQDDEAVSYPQKEEPVKTAKRNKPIAVVAVVIAVFILIFIVAQMEKTNSEMNNLQGGEIGPGDSTAEGNQTDKYLPDNAGESITVATGSLSLTVPESFYRTETYSASVEEDTWCDISIQEGAFSPLVDIAGEINLRDSTYEDYEHIDGGPLSIDKHNAFWYECKYPREDGPVIEYVLFTDRPDNHDGDIIIRLVAGDNGSLKDYERLKQWLLESIKYSDETEGNASFIKGFYVSNEGLTSSGTKVTAGGVNNIDQMAELSAGRLIAINSYSAYAAAYDMNNQTEDSASAEEIYKGYLAYEQVSGDVIQSGEINIDGVKCYEIRANTEYDSLRLGYCYLFIPIDNDKGVMQTEIVVKGDVGSEEAKKTIDEIVSSIKMGTD